MKIASDSSLALLCSIGARDGLPGQPHKMIVASDLSAIDFLRRSLVAALHLFNHYLKPGPSAQTKQ